MADFNALEALINAYIKQNGVKAITGNILNGVLRGMVSALGKGWTIADGDATPTTDPGTMTGPVAYIAHTAGTYEHFGNLVVNDGEVALLKYNEQTWTKEVIASLAATASVDGNVGTPAVDVTFQNGVLSFDFRNMKGNTGDAAGFGTVNATVDANIGTPGVSVQTSGPDTAKNLTFAFTNLKGETGVTSVVATVDNTVGTPSCAVSLVGQELHLDFTGLKGPQGDTGSSVDYPFTIVNNLTTNDATQALSAAMGVQLESEISQLDLKVDGVHETHYTEGGYIKSDGTVASSENCAYSDYIPVSAGQSITLDYGTIASALFVVIYNIAKSKLDYWTLTTSYTTKNFTTPANTAYMRFAWTKGYNAKAYANDVLIWQAIVDVDGLEDRVSDLESDVQTIEGDVSDLAGTIEEIAKDKDSIDYGIKNGYSFSWISGASMSNVTITDTQTGINIAKTENANLTFRIEFPNLTKAGTYHFVCSSNKEMNFITIYKDGVTYSSESCTDNACEFDFTFDGTYVLGIGTQMYYDQSSQDYSIVATIPSATGMAVIADNLSERVETLEDAGIIPSIVSGTNTFLGDGAGKNNTPIEGGDNGKYNTAVGKNAMRYNTLGDHCTALGFCAMNKNQDGRNNTALGEDALYENLHGGQNVAIGQHSGQDSQGSYNVFIGSNVARRMASGNLNVIIGAEAYNDYDQLGGSNMVLIGAYVRNSGNYDGVISIKGEEPTAAKQIRIGKADFSAFIIGNKKLNFNQDGTVTWEDVTPTP